MRIQLPPWHQRLLRQPLQHQRVSPAVLHHAQVLLQHHAVGPAPALDEQRQAQLQPQQPQQQLVKAVVYPAGWMYQTRISTRRG
jgi:hypothetical protein